MQGVVTEFTKLKVHIPIYEHNYNYTAAKYHSKLADKQQSRDRKQQSRRN